MVTGDKRCEALYPHLLFKSAASCFYKCKNRTVQPSLLLVLDFLVRQENVNRHNDVEYVLLLSCFSFPGDCVAASRDELHIRKMKLNYQEVGQCSKDSQAWWERKLTAPGRTTVPQDKEEMYRALCQGERCVCFCV